MFQLFFLTGCEILLMCLAFLFNFLFLCTHCRHRAVYILNAFGFINCCIFFQISTSCYVSPHSWETVERFVGLPHCIGPFCNTPSCDSHQKRRKDTGLLLVGLLRYFHTPFFLLFFFLLILELLGLWSVFFFVVWVSS